MDDAKKRVFLRAWQDQTLIKEGKRYVRLAHHSRYAENLENLGYRERVRHLDTLRNSHSGYVVMCKAKDPLAKPRAIGSFNEREVFQIGEIVEFDGDDWGEVKGRIPVRELT